MPEPCPVPTDPEQELLITCAFCGVHIDFRRGEVYLSPNRASYVCRQHAGPPDILGILAQIISAAEGAERFLDLRTNETGRWLPWGDDGFREEAIHVWEDLALALHRWKRLTDAAP